MSLIYVGHLNVGLKTFMKLYTGISRDNHQKPFNTSLPSPNLFFSPRLKKNFFIPSQPSKDFSF